MSISPELMYAILAMDAYNRGDKPGIILSGTAVGNAEIRDFTVPLQEWQAADFSAVAYDWLGDTIISYRGTDTPAFELPLVDWPIAFNDDYDEAQVHLANRFYQAVAGAAANTEPILLTGHSLGGALAGFVGMVVYGSSLFLSILEGLTMLKLSTRHEVAGVLSAKGDCL